MAVTQPVVACVPYGQATMKFLSVIASFWVRISRAIARAHAQLPPNAPQDLRAVGILSIQAIRVALAFVYPSAGTPAQWAVTVV
jgi:hypothetical protein